MGKVLFTASVAKHILRFHLPYLDWFQRHGFETHVACAGDEEIPFTHVKHYVPFVRNPISFEHFRAYKRLREVLLSEKFDVIHCHTPMASVISRIAARKYRRKGLTIIYTAHGFHFYKGSSLFNWIFYFPIEWLLSGYCDAVITINQEDFTLAKIIARQSTKIYKIHGVGVNSLRFFPVDETEKIEFRLKNGFKKNDFILVYAAEFIPRKNHKFIIQSASYLVTKIPNLKILFAGRGKLERDLKLLVDKNGLGSSIVFLGFRDDIHEVFKFSDVGISSSKQEGLGLNLVEEMMCGLPIVASTDRGHVEVVKHEINGFLYEQGSTVLFSEYILKLYESVEMRIRFSTNSIELAKKFHLDNSISEMAEIYNEQIIKLNDKYNYNR